MQECPVRLKKIAFTSCAVELPPGATVRMPIGAQVAQTKPASIVTVRMRAKMPGGIHLTRAPVRRGHRIGAHRRRRRGMCGLVCTQGTRGLLGQARKQFGLDGVLTRGLDGLRLDWLLRGYGSSAGPAKVHDETQTLRSKNKHMVR